MTKIAIITENFPPQGVSGVSSAHYNLYRLFKTKGLDVKVFTFNDISENIKLLPQNPDAYHYGTSKKIRRFIRLLIPKLYKYQRKIFYKTDTHLLAYQLIDVIIANLGSRKINIELQKFNPSVVIVPDHGVPGYAIKKIKTARFIHVSHHNPIRFANNPFFGYQSNYDARLALKFEKKALNKIDKVVCPSNYMKEIFVKTFGFTPNALVIPNLIDDSFIEGIEPVSVQQKLSLDAAFPVVYIPSGGSPYKGERFVVELIRRLAVQFNFRIGFYVSGGLSTIQEIELKTLKAYNQLVYSPGLVENHLNIGLIKSCTVCVSPTLVENFSMAILEANFCNIPVIAFDAGGNKEIIEDGKNGYIVPYLDMEPMIQKTRDILESNTPLKSHDYVKARFSSQVLAEKYLDLIDSL